MPLDPKRLARDAKMLEAARPVAAIGRETTGVTRAVRAFMPTIRELRNAGVRWGAIAEALARQDIVGADKQPLSASRLTAVVDRIDKGHRKQADRIVARGRRSDLVEAAPPVQVPTSPAITALGRTAPTGSEHRTAEQIRRDDLAELHDILKGKTS